MIVNTKVTVSLDNLRGAGKRVADLTPAMTRSVPRVMRFGEGSISEQFESQVTRERTGGYQWQSTKDFGNQKRPRRTLQRSGKYRAAWLGLGGGRKLVAGKDRVLLGVDTSAFPQAYVFQATGPTTIAVTARMRAYLAGVFGVYLRKETRTITNTPRRVAISAPMVRRAVEAIRTYVLIGEAPE